MERPTTPVRCPHEALEVEAGLVETPTDRGPLFVLHVTARCGTCHERFRFLNLPGTESLHHAGTNRGDLFTARLPVQPGHTPVPRPPKRKRKRR